MKVGNEAYGVLKTATDMNPRIKGGNYQTLNTLIQSEVGQDRWINWFPFNHDLSKVASNSTPNPTLVLEGYITKFTISHILSSARSGHRRAYLFRK